MDIRFIAVIFLIAALMEFLGKLARKRREQELEDGSAPRPADPLAGVIEELRRLPRGDEPEREVVVREGGDRGLAEGSAPGAKGPGVTKPERGRVMPAAPARSPARAATDSVVPVPAGRVAEPVIRRGLIERVFDPVTPPPPVPVVEPEPTPTVARVVPGRDRSPRPVEARSREGRPREARDLAERAWAGESAATADRRTGGRDGRRRAGTRRARQGDDLDLSSVSGLRRLVVAREVLGPPLALRDGERFPGR